MSFTTSRVLERYNSVGTHPSGPPVQNDDTTGSGFHQIENGDWPTRIEGMDMASEKDAQTQWEDPSLSDHNFSSGDHIKPTTCEAGTQCPALPLQNPAEE